MSDTPRSRRPTKGDQELLVHPVFSLPVAAAFYLLALPISLIGFLLSAISRIVRGVVSTQCWFCHTYEEIPWRLRNGWQCIHCGQYNGFDKDGGYNQVVAAQYNEALNSPVVARGMSEPKAKDPDVLCRPCSDSQEAIVTAMANFTPKSERRYEVEARMYRARLEHEHPLCRGCQATAAHVITRRNAWASNWAIVNRRRAMAVSPLAASSAPCMPQVYRGAAMVLYMVRLLLALVTMATWATLLTRRVEFTETTWLPPMRMVPVLILSGAVTNGLVAIAVGKRLIRRVDVHSLAAWGVCVAVVGAARVLRRHYPAYMDMAVMIAAAWVAIAQMSVLLLPNKFGIWRDRRRRQVSPPLLRPGPGVSVPMYKADTPEEVAELMAKIVDLGSRGAAIYGLDSKKRTAGAVSGHGGRKACPGMRTALVISLAFNVVAMTAAASLFPHLFALAAAPEPQLLVSMAIH